MLLVCAKRDVEQELNRAWYVSAGLVAAAAALCGHEELPELGLVQAELVAEGADFFAGVGLDLHVGASGVEVDILRANGRCPRAVTVPPLVGAAPAARVWRATWPGVDR